MNYRRRLFTHSKPYDINGTKELFLHAVKENIALHQKNCAEYAGILKAYDFDVSQIESERDLHRIPALTTLYFKRNRMLSVDEKKLAVKATSSGTKGRQSFIGFDRTSLYYGIRMMQKFFSFHNVISLLPANYIVLSYQPSERMDIGATKTAYGTTKFAPALHREYALKDMGDRYEINIDGIKRALMRYSKMPFPVRFVGFPSYMYFLAETLEKNGIKLKLHKKSKIILGGGWKQFSDEQIDPESFYRLMYDTLGIERKNCLEFYSAVEHPLPYCKCQNGHFHVPIYSRVIIRDADTLEPLGMDSLGLLSFVSPLMSSVPLVSVMTDDMAVLKDGISCGCGIETPYFELKGRAGVRQIKTCTTDAAALLGSVKQ